MTPFTVATVYLLTLVAMGVITGMIIGTLM